MSECKEVNYPTTCPRCRLFWGSDVADSFRIGSFQGAYILFSCKGCFIDLVIFKKCGSLEVRYNE